MEEQNEIKKAYRSASLKYHPDRNSSKDAVTKIQEINEAYEILSDKDKKQNYGVRFAELIKIKDLATNYTNEHELKR